MHLAKCFLGILGGSLSLFDNFRPEWSYDRLQYDGVIAIELSKSSRTEASAKGAQL